MRVAVIGSGPSGFYTTKYLLSQNPDIMVDLYEKLPFPFGLVRYGVAPDHPEVKSVSQQFAELANTYLKAGRFRFFGNVSVGDDAVPLATLDKAYSAVVFTYGAADDHHLGIPGEKGPGVLTARSFVNWYNGHPHFVQLPVDIEKARRIAIVGHGNVALDCARILAKPISELETTDITEYALNSLRNCNVEHVTILGRRGHVQSSFTIKELRELSKLAGVNLVLRPEEIEKGWTAASRTEAEQQPGKKRLLQLMETLSKETPSQSNKVTIEIRFLLTPEEVVRTDDGQIQALRCRRSRLEGDPFAQKAITAGEPSEDLPCDLIIESVGYKAQPLSPSLPFDSRRNVISTNAARVVRNTPADSAQWYAAGWVRRGPSGIIGTNITDAREAAGALLEDLAAGKLPTRAVDPLQTLPREATKNLISWEMAERLHNEEVRRGEASTPPKPREKITNPNEVAHLHSEWLG